jgi:hypothetical protein
MRRTLLRNAILLIAAVELAHSETMAQVPNNRPSPPAVSPYLNLLRRGGGPGFNYFTLVRPELEMRKTVRQMQLSLGDLRRQQEILQQQETMPATGHPTYFMNTGWYFNVGPRQGPISPTPGVSSAATRRVWSIPYR